MWSTTFYFRQELRSEYMNNLVKGLIKPGIYNMNAAIYTQSNSPLPSQEGIWLRIKAGAMLIFSNGYDVVDGKVIRNLDKLGSYVVKCIADTDEDYQIGVPLGTNSALFESSPTSPGRSKIPTAFVYAKFAYDPESQTVSTPTFSIAAPSSNVDIGSDAEYILPNEGTPSAESDYRESYLVLGCLLDNGVNAAPYNLAEDWYYEGNAQQKWMNNHVFTARGLPDYRGALSKSFSQSLLSLAFAPSYNRVYITPGQFYFNSTIYELSGSDWKEIYGQNGPAVSTAPTSASGGIADHFFATEAATSYTQSNLSLAGLGGKLVVEFLFLGVSSEYARATDETLSNLFTGTSTTKKILPYRIVCDCPPGLDLNTQALSASYLSAATAVLPLDISLVNIERLKAILMNKTILPLVIDKIRQAALTASPYLDPTDGESLIPLLITFRKVNAGGTGYDDPQTVTTAPGLKQASGAVGASGVNPVNALSFFELQSSSFSILGAALAAQEVFATIPFLD